VILIDAQGLTMSRPGKPLFSDLSLTIETGDRLAIVGLNGGGKSTLLRVLAGTETPETGVVRRKRDLHVAMLDQRPTFPPGSMRDALTAMAQGGPGAWEIDAVADRLGLTPLLDADVATLSGGQAKRAALAATLVADAELLILDEPTNHLDIDAIAWLEDRLAAFRGALVLVTHDRHVLDRTTTRILELDRGHGYLHEGGYAGYLEGKAEREMHVASNEATRQNLARRELAWLRRGAPARTRKSKSRIERANELIESRPEGPARTGDPDLYLGTPRLGDQVIELHDVDFAYDGATAPLLRKVELALANRERLGVVGVNGTGKSTLLDLVAGRTAPGSGTVVQGSTVRIGYYDQIGRTLDPKMRVREAVVGPHRQVDWQDTKLMEQFWFDSDAQWAPIGLLSGGERRRLQLLLVLSEKPNVLLLDEPTNDLDLDTLRVLEDFLEDWPGALVVVSHDRAFLERTVDDVVVLDGSGRVARMAGGYAAWEDERRASRVSGTTRRRTEASSSSSASASASASASSSSKASSASSAATATVDAGPGPSLSTLRHRLKETEKAIRPLDKKKALLEAELLTGTADHQRMAEAGALLASVLGELAALEERWLEIGEQLESHR
jgi:ATP-binding cassette subfamily F protein uup